MKDCKTAANYYEDNIKTLGKIAMQDELNSRGVERRLAEKKAAMGVVAGLNNSPLDEDRRDLMWEVDDARFVCVVLELTIADGEALKQR
ncbi:uncharacterized protein J3R85_005512 [Psidium guajava]|nr:uncharacterized protein J3R85_005512 [Psidium guajava]